MDVSWSVTSIAAEVLNDWPRNFNRMLHNIMARHSDTGGNRFPARFGFFYATLFRRFSESPFEFLRAAFENFIAENWQGPLAKRNKRLSQAILDRASWVPANHACKSMNISRSRLTHLVATGQIEGEERLSQKGRRFLMIKRTSMECFSITLNDEVDLSTAAALLGLTTHRVRSAIAALFPDAKKTESDATPWAISRKEIDTFLSHSIVSISDAVGDGDVCFDHVLRYWTCSDAEIATLLISMRDGTIKPVARLAKNKGVSHLIFNETQVRSLIARQRIGLSQEWSVPEIANMLSVKQEVAYFLIRSGLLKSEEKVVGKRKAAFVSRAALDEFKLTYVFLRDLAKLRVTSSKALQSRLTECGIYPVTSNIAQRCRQVIYSRNRELQNVLGTLKFPNLGPDFG
jgi:hypothetical protein